MSRLVPITGMEARELAVPLKSRRGPYLVNYDILWIDARRMKRQRRRYLQQHGRTPKWHHTMAPMPRTTRSAD